MEGGESVGRRSESQGGKRVVGEKESDEEEGVNGREEGGSCKEE